MRFVRKCEANQMDTDSHLEEPSFDPDAAISELASGVLTGMKRKEFQNLARELAAGIEVEDLDYLQSRFHSPPPEPPEYDHRKHGLGGWLSSCQFAIFELIYQLKSEAIPFLRAIAWGPYDWTQGNAIELMIRMAAEGIETEEIIGEIAANYPDIRYEAQLYALEPLMPMAREDRALNTLLDRMRTEIPALDQIAGEVESRLPAT